MSRRAKWRGSFGLDAKNCRMTNVALRLFPGPIDLGEILRTAAGAEIVGEGKTLFVSGAGADVARLRALLVRETGKTVVSPPVFSFVGLATALVNQTGRQYRWLGPSEKERLVWELLARQVRSGKAKRLVAVAGYNGTPRTIADALGRIRRSVADTAQAARLLAEAGEVEGEFGVLLAEYEAALKQFALLDGEEVLRAGALALARGEATLPIGGLGRVVALCSLHLSTAELGFLRGLAHGGGPGEVGDGDEGAGECKREGQGGGWCGRVEAFVPYAAHAAFKGAARRLEDLARVVSGVDVTFEGTAPGMGAAPGSGADAGRAADLPALLAESLSMGSGHRVEVVTAPSRRREVREVAARIKELAVVGGIPPAEVAVVVSEPVAYKPIIDDVFQEAGIGAPPRVATADSAHAVAAALSLLELPLLDWPRRPTVEAIGGGPWGLVPAAVWRLDRYSQSNGVSKGWADWMDVLDNAPGLAAAATLGRLHDRLAVAQGCPTVSEVARKVLGLFREVRSLSRLTEGHHRRLRTASPGRRNRWLEEYVLEVAAWRELERTLEELSVDPPWAGALLGGQQVPDGLSAAPEPAVTEAARDGSTAGPSTAYQDFFVLLRSVLAERVIRAGRALPGGPEVFDPRTFSGGGPDGFRAVFVLGLLDGELPRRRTRAWMWGRVAERACRLGIAAPEPDPADDDAAALVGALRAAGERVSLSYPSLDAAEKETLASPFVRQVREAAALAGVEVREVRVDPAGQWRIPASQAISRKEWLAAAPPFVIAAAGPPLGNIVQAALARSGGNRPPVFDGTLAGAASLAFLRRRYDEEFRHSATRLSSFGSCPFSYFCRYELRLEPLEEPAGDISPLEMGELYHEVLWRFFTAKPGRVLERSARAQYRAEMAEHLEDVAAATLASKPRAIRDAWRARAREAERLLLNLVDREIADAEKLGGSVKPAFCELAFGLSPRPGERRDPASTTGPLFVENSAGKRVALAGKIDRVDVGEGGFFAIYDYKSGGGRDEPHPLDACLDGLDFQLPVYLLAAGKVFARQLGGDRAVGAAFYRLGTADRKDGIWRETAARVADLGRKRKGILPEAEWDEALKAACDWMVAYAASIAEGRFPVRPKLCRKDCSYRSLCGRPKRGGNGSAGGWSGDESGVEEGDAGGI